MLKERFADTTDPALKSIIASTLVAFGVAKDREFFESLLKLAQEAVDNDAPSAVAYDSQGKSLRRPKQLPPDFVAWAKARGLDPNAAAYAQVYQLPTYVLLLGMTGDPRARDTLRKGLSSRNFQIQAVAAQGVTKLQDKESITLIIQACEGAPAEAAFGIAWYLLYFDDPQAQSAAEKFIPDKQLLDSLRKWIREKGPDPYAF